MYHPPNDLEDLQYIELFNPDSTEADLSGWKFNKGVKFSFPPDTRMPSGGFLVVCRNLTKFIQRYGAAVPLAGEFSGHLSHNGERVELSDDSQTAVDSVKYSDSAEWPTAADGRSSSLERICPKGHSDDHANWAASKVREFLTPGGTPGGVNDSFSANLPPVIAEVGLSPAKPPPGQAITVSAAVSDPDGVKSVALSFQVATVNELSNDVSIEMKRVSGDEYAGRYEAILPPQPAGRLVRYRIYAIDAALGKRSSPDANDLRLAWSYSTFVNENDAKVPFGILLRPGNPKGRPAALRGTRPEGERSRGLDTFVYMPASSEEVRLFDFVDAPPRNGGFKVHFRKDETLRGMTTINVIFEGVPRYMLTEALSYEVYRMAGVPAELTEHIRVWVDGRPLGYHLLIEQPNKSFLARNKRNTDGNLYKLLWYGNGIVGKHEKKTNLQGGHDDLLSIINDLRQTSGAEQWPLIERHFNVEEFVNYFAVNMCIQNWDGYHNNYFAYHDTGDTGRWEIYPWDEDKTWGDYDGATRRRDWYEMPLTFGMNGSQPPEALRARGAPNGFVAWWREPGYFSGPLLANPEFRRRFLVRLREICTTVFTEEKIHPLIDQMARRLEPEVPIRAALQRMPVEVVLAEFREDIESLRKQVIHRRRFVLAELEKLELSAGKKVNESGTSIGSKAR